MNDSEHRILELLKAYKVAVYERDAEVFLHLYDQEARVFDAWDVWSYEGAASDAKQEPEFYQDQCQEIDG